MGELTIGSSLSDLWNEHAFWKKFSFRANVECFMEHVWWNEGNFHSYFYTGKLLTAWQLMVTAMLTVLYCVNIDILSKFLLGNSKICVRKLLLFARKCATLGRWKLSQFCCKTIFYMYILMLHFAAVFYKIKARYLTVVVKMIQHLLNDDGEKNFFLNEIIRRKKECVLKCREFNISKQLKHSRFLAVT